MSDLHERARSLGLTVLPVLAPYYAVIGVVNVVLVPREPVVGLGVLCFGTALVMGGIAVGLRTVESRQVHLVLLAASAVAIAFALGFLVLTGDPQQSVILVSTLLASACLLLSVTSTVGLAVFGLAAWLIVARGFPADAYLHWLINVIGAGVLSVLISWSRVRLLRDFQREIVERGQAVGALVQSEHRFEAMAESAPVMIWMAGPDRQCTYLNRQWLEFTGRPMEDLLGQGWIDSMHADDLEGSLETYDAAVGSARSFTNEYRFRRFDGAYRWMIASGTPQFSAEGELAGYVGSSVDVTTLKRAEGDLLHARDQALETSRLKSEFLATMSHELRTPMNVIFGMMDILLDTPLTDEQRRFADTVRSSADGLLDIINDILDFSRIDAGTLELASVEFDPVKALEDARASLAPRAAAKQIALSTSFAQDLPRTLRGDPGRLRQVLLNLIGNAIKFTEEGAVTAHVEVATHDGTDLMARFTVTDTGIGIATDSMHRLFKSFSQVDGSMSRRHGGTGLGLAISKQLVALMGGEIGVESIPGMGSTFWFTVRFVAPGVPLHAAVN